MFVKNIEEQSKSALFHKLKKVLLHLFLTLKFCILKIFVYTFDTVIISVTFIKHYHFIVVNVIFNIFSCAFKTSQCFFHENVITFEITAAFLT